MGKEALIPITCVVGLIIAPTFPNSDKIIGFFAGVLFYYSMLKIKE